MSGASLTVHFYYWRAKGATFWSFFVFIFFVFRDPVLQDCLCQSYGTAVHIHVELFACLPVTKHLNLLYINLVTLISFVFFSFQDASRNPVCHTATVIANSYMHCGTTSDTFLRYAMIQSSLKKLALNCRFFILKLIYYMDSNCQQNM